MLSIYDWFGYDLPIQDRYRRIKEAGFDGVLLWWGEALGRGDYRGGPQIARDAGLVIENIHTPFQVQDHIWLDNLDGEAAADCYLQCVADCAAFGIPTMVVHLPDEDKPCSALGLGRFKRIAWRAQRLGVNVALENLHNLPALAYVLGEIDSPRVGFCYDCAHHHRHYPGAGLLGRYGSRLMALHLHDNHGGAMHRLPFDGTIDWPAAMKAIAATGYSGATAVEAMNWDYKDLSPEEFLARAHERALRLEALRL
jgi:sugar phosphate isomerase/epimerase